MACFVVPMAEAIIVSIAKKIIEKKQRKALVENSNETCASQTKSIHPLQTRFDWCQKLSWLNNLLWGGVFLLALEHIWHGEIILWPPFLTAMRNPSDILPMLHEMAFVGTSMAIFVTMVCGVMIFIAEHKTKYFFEKSYSED